MKWTDIRNIDEGIETFKDMLSNKKVLILLDDVDHKEHMDALVGKRDRFGEGTKIIITTRNKEVLKVPEVDDYYEVDIMDPLQSLRLFSKHAFRRDYPLAEYMDETIKAITIAGGLPLALEVIGSLLSCTEKERWNDKLTKLKDVPPKELMRQLRISYDALEVHERHIFLDIACFFIGSYKYDLVYLWESKFHPEDALNVLENMSLIKIKEDNEVWMHDQLRDLGRQIIRQESTMKIEEQCRVWDPEEALDLLKRHERKKKVEALRLHFGHQHRFTYKDFKRLPYLRFLEVYGSKETFHAEERFFLHESPSNFVPTNVFQENSNILPRLRWLSWNDIPPTFNITNFSMEDVVFLDLSRSEITHDWKGWSHMKVMKNLKILNLSYCQRLKRNPNFSAHSNLERLNLSDCKSLIEIDRSICHLIRLVSLDVSNCRDLRRLPEELGGNLARLKYLSLNYCKSLEKLPDSIGNLESLIELHISSTGIRELPDSIINLRTLKVVKMWHSVMSKISKALWTIEKLEEIEFHKSIRPGIHVKIGDCIYRNQSLRILKLVDMEINALPVLPKGLIELELSCLDMDMDMFPDLSNLTNLKVLDLWFGPPNYEGISNGLVEVSIPWWIGNLSKLESLDLGSPYVTTSPTDLTLPLHLKSLLLFCPNLRRLPRLPSSLSSSSLQHCKSLCSMEDLSNLEKLSFLEIDDAAITEVQGLGCLENLRDLRFIGLQQVKILSALTNLNKLMRIRVGCCGNLVEIQGELPESLENLEIDSCKSLQKLPDLSSLNGLREVRIHRCEKLNVEAISRLCSEKSIMFRQSRF